MIGELLAVSYVQILMHSIPDYKRRKSMMQRSNVPAQTEFS